MKPISKQFILLDGVSYEPDALLFIQAAALSDATQKTAINNLVIQLKAASLWSKMQAIYPFVGGTANSHKYNLKAPQDSDSAFRLTYFGGLTHDSNGIKGNGTNGYADTNLTPSTAGIGLNDTHISFYASTSGDATTHYLGGIFISPSYLYIRMLAASTDTGLNGALATSACTINNGMILSTRLSSTTWARFENNVKISVTNNSNSLSTQKFPIGAIRTGAGTLSNYNNSSIRFASIGSGLTDGEASTFYNIVQAYQTTLNRNL